ncbi:hypothetical protein HXX76_009834 [Chlamydomonas incerta]|uniref:O-fucosyltransferase family protein n=1 Tax=Chlamydomonas incerta TaxID=51695 RepID=A0A835T1R1_CHLIN|nr:hypothetical protein HXX76_009834 [Chlamydomonas incerta]|eukprot:KAG2430860.1 hypothetical protein HXX76_009834 [Chlamydomonas incerta]
MTSGGPHQRGKGSELDAEAACKPGRGLLGGPFASTQRPRFSSLGLSTTLRKSLLLATVLLVGYSIGALNHRCSLSSSGSGASFVQQIAAALGTSNGGYGSSGSSSGSGSDGGSSRAWGMAGAGGAAGSALGDFALVNKTLRFPVCNGFANQRLSILYGVVLAKRLGRAAVLPVLVDNGLQRGDSAVLATANNQIPFEEMYDLPHFLTSMAGAGVRVLLPADAPPANTVLRLAGLARGQQGGVSEALATTYASIRHIAIDCPLFKLGAEEMQPGFEPLVWAALNGLRPSKEAAALVDKISRAISSKAAALARGSSSSSTGSSSTASGGGSSSSAAAAAASAADANLLAVAGATNGARGGGGRGAIRVARSRALQAASDWATAAYGPARPFNFIHLRIENDWIEHCRRWESIRDGIVRDNCYAHTDEVAEQLALFGFSNSTPLYVGSYWDDVEPARRDTALAKLRAAGYTLVTSADVFPAAAAAVAAGAGGSSAGSGAGGAAIAANELEGRGREYRAMIEYFVGLRAQRFIGNSVSTFAALGMLERRRAGRWAAYYNGGNIPLASVLPLLHRLPWVFTYNSWSGQYDYLLKGAVRSALATRSFQPYCIFMGNETSAIHSWLVAHNVTVIAHEPAWREQLLALAGRKAQNNVAHSHLYKTPDSLVSTFQRVDLPVVPVLDQYSYVLYTDADVFFRRPIRLDDFGLPLPRSVSMSYEMDPMFPYNAGVIVANLPVMRRNYKAFIAMMLDPGVSEGLYYPGFGPADQGIINKFYEADLRGRMLNQLFNAKPYSTFDNAAYILHFHGPKPHEYAAYLNTGQCDFKGLCEKAFAMSLCRYTREWARWVPEEPVALRLGDACGLLDNPAFQRLRGTTS